MQLPSRFYPVSYTKAVALLVFAGCIVLYRMIFTNNIPSPSLESSEIREKQDLISSSGVHEYFHLPAHNQINQIVNESTIISWGGLINSENVQESDVRPLFPDLDIMRIHELSPAEKEKVWSNISHYYVWEENICYATRGFNDAGRVKKHVLFTYLNENRGAFSRDVPDRTVLWDSYMTNWKDFGCTDKEVWDYVNHENMRAIFTMQHQSYNHEKIHSIPLGIKRRSIKTLLKRFQMPLKNKTQLLMINNSGWRHRANITEAVMANFKGQLKDTYNKTSANMDTYLNELEQSKFVLAPSGLGWDSYRIWETLYLGSIPIVERYGRPIDGWRRTLDDLPVLWVEYFSEVTPELLEQEYLIIASKATNYNYKKLTIPWWVDFIRSLLQDLGLD